MVTVWVLWIMGIFFFFFTHITTTKYSRYFLIPLCMLNVDRKTNVFELPWRVFPKTCVLFNVCVSYIQYCFGIQTWHVCQHVSEFSRDTRGQVTKCQKIYLKTRKFYNKRKLKYLLLPSDYNFAYYSSIFTRLISCYNSFNST